MTRRNQLPILALTLALTAGLAGCGDNEEPDISPGPKPTTSQPAEPVPSASPTADSTGAPAATGLPIEGDNVSYHLPDGKWTLGTRSGNNASFTDAEVSGIWTVTLRETGRVYGAVDLDELADFSGVGDPLVEDPPLKRGENRVVDGVEGYTATTTTTSASGRKTHVQIYGTSHQGRHVSWSVTGPADDRRTEEWFEAVLASIEWK